MPWSSNIVSQLVLQGTSSGLFIYNGTPALGTLIGSWASTAGVDPYGNPYPTGINVLAGSLQGVSLSSASIVGGTIFSALVNASDIHGSTMVGGNISETVITFDSGGGGLFLYTTTTTTNTFTTSQNMTAPPASVASMNVQVWGGDAGAGGGNATGGGEGGGGAEFAGEPAYPNYNPSGTYPIAIGAGGLGGTTNSAGTSGQQSSFDNTGVVAGGGLAGSAGTGGLGGNISKNSVHYPGGNGGSNPSSFTSSAGGGGRAGTTGAGGNGAAPTSNAAPGAGGAAGTGTGGIAGSNGVLAATNGNSGNAGGSGAGAASGATQLTKQYRPIHSYAYYGAGVGNGLRNTDGSMFQGDPDVPVTTFPGDQYSFAYYGLSGSGTPCGDFSGYTIDSVQVQIQNAHSWYNSGCYIIWGYSAFTTFGSTGNLSGATENVQSNWINEGALSTYDLTAAYGTAIQAGSWSSILLGPSSSTSGGSLDLWNYGYFNGGPTYGPLLTVKGHTGSGNFSGGNGSNGKVIVSYQSSNVMVAALSPVAGSDASGNAFPAGYIGDTQAFHPGSSPKTVETSQTITLLNSWSARGGNYPSLGCIKVPGGPGGMVLLFGSLTHSSLTTGTSSQLGTLPSGYIPAHNYDFECNIVSNTPFTTITGATGTPCIEIASSTGSITLFNYTSGTTGVQFCVIYPLGV